MSNAAMSVRCAGQYPREAPRSAPDEPDRPRLIRFLQLASMTLMTLDEAARALQVSPATLDRRKRELLADDRQDTDDLRKLEQARKSISSDS